MCSLPRLARPRRCSSRLPSPTVAGESDEHVVLTRQGGARVEYIGLATIRPAADLAARNDRLGTFPAALQPAPIRACHPAGRPFDAAYVVSDAGARRAARLAQFERGCRARTDYGRHAASSYSAARSVATGLRRPPRRR